MLELWRSPQGAGDPLGCLATTYTFHPALFEEQCLARFLEIESDPSREGLAFLLEREIRLGSVYAGVMVDHTQAGVKHSLRWDVLPVRIRGGKQHAKLSLLVWSKHVRLIVASANLTEPGYRLNQETAAAVDFTAADCQRDVLTESIGFLRRLSQFVKGAAQPDPAVQRASAFLDQVEAQTAGWQSSRRGARVRQSLATTLPASESGPAESALDQAIKVYRLRGGSPYQVWIASPFFEPEKETSAVVAALCKQMARGRSRDLYFCVPGQQNSEQTAPRLLAPRSLIDTPSQYQGTASVEVLPDRDGMQVRPWHAKMLMFIGDNATGLFVGSSNFTCSGMGISTNRNAEANLLTLADQVEFGRETGQLEAIWPECRPVDDPDAAEWLGSPPELEETEEQAAAELPPGFEAAVFQAGATRRIVLSLNAERLPPEWQITTAGSGASELLTSLTWTTLGRPSIVELPWEPTYPPETLSVTWADCHAEWSLNVDDPHLLPRPERLDELTADELLSILAASDPSAAIRAAVGGGSLDGEFDEELDSALPIDLDPLRRYHLADTFLHQVRRRARILAQLRENLQRPAWSQQTVEWRLRGLLGIQALTDRLVQEFQSESAPPDEMVLRLADLLIVLAEVNYEPVDGSLTKADFDRIYRPFLSEVASCIDQQAVLQQKAVSPDVMQFWNRVVEKCQK